jgi:MFS family permease
VTIVAGIAYCLTIAGPPIAQGLLSLAFALFFFGVTSGAMDVGMNALAVEIEQRSGKPIMSSIHGMWSAGGFAGAIVGSFFARENIGVQMHLFSIAGALLVTMIIARRWLPPSTVVAAEPASHFVRPQAAMLGLGVIVFCSFLIEGAMADWSAVLLRDSFDASEATAALGYAAFSLAMMVMRFIGDRVVTPTNATSFVRTMNLIAAAAFAFALWSQLTPALLIALILMGIAVATLAPLVFRAAGNRASSNAGSAIAAMATLGYGGFLVGPPVVGWFAQVSSLSIALVIVVLLAVTIAGMAGHLAEPK